jgi:hypothetical protein
MSSPKIIMPSVGVHNADPEASRERLRKARQYEDLSTVCIVPTRGQIPAQVVEGWMSMMKPMNQAFVGPIFAQGLEVADAYNAVIEIILEHPQLKDFKYVLTLEEDNYPTPDGLLTLYDSIRDHDVVGGLYWTKGWGGQPMIYGRPDQIPQFAPQMPSAEEWGGVIECNGLGMGFTLFRMDIFRELEKPWFKTLSDWDPYGGIRMATQDLYFFDKARAAGKRIACDTRCLVAHFDSNEERAW